MSEMVAQTLIMALSALLAWWIGRQQANVGREQASIARSAADSAREDREQAARDAAESREILRRLQEAHERVADETRRQSDAQERRSLADALERCPRVFVKAQPHAPGGGLEVSFFVKRGQAQPDHVNIVFRQEGQVLTTLAPREALRLDGQRRLVVWRQNLPETQRGLEGELTWTALGYRWRSPVINMQSEPGQPLARFETDPDTTPENLGPI